MATETRPFTFVAKELPGRIEIWADYGDRESLAVADVALSLTGDEEHAEEMRVFAKLICESVNLAPLPAEAPAAPPQDFTKDELKAAESALLRELGVSWSRCNSVLQVHIYEPTFKVESLVPSSRDYTAHFELDKAWKVIVRMRAELSRARALLKGGC